MPAKHEQHIVRNLKTHATWPQGEQLLEHDTNDGNSKLAVTFKPVVRAPPFQKLKPLEIIYMYFPLKLRQ